MTTYSRADQEVETLIRDLVSTDFPSLACLRFSYVFRSQHRVNKEQQVVVARVRIASARDHDLYDTDVEIEIAEDIWDAMAQRKGNDALEARKAVLWHELNHIYVHLDQDDEPVYRKSGRVKVELRAHDISLTTFAEEIAKYGPTETQLKICKQLAAIAKRVKKGELPIRQDPPVPVS